MKGLHFRSDFAHSTEGLRELIRLIYDVFDVDVSVLDRLGHDPSVVAFGWWFGDELVANVSLYERRLWLSGAISNAFGVQSVAVRPEWRGQGLFRDLMSKALKYADARTNLVILATETPSLYNSFGFRSVQESYFQGRLNSQRASPNCRRMSLTDKADLALLMDFFAHRVPTSLTASACDHPALFMLKLVHDPDIELVHLPALNAVVAVRGINHRMMTVLDIVAPSIPPLEDIAANLGYAGEHIKVCLTPDLLRWAPRKIVLDPPKYMVRGPYPPEGKAFMLSTMRL